MRKESRQQGLSFQEGDERDVMLPEGEGKNTDSSPKFNQDYWYLTSASSD